jgi:hypothetical protein
MFILHEDWEVFKIGDKEFIALMAENGNVHIYGHEFADYGLYTKVETFIAEWHRKEGKILAVKVNKKRVFGRDEDG